MRTLGKTATSAKLRRRGLAIVTNSINTLLLPMFNIVISLIVTRLASVDLWGQFVNVLILVQIGVHIIGWGNKEYLLREFSLHPARIPKSWQTSLITRLALLSGFCLVLSFMGLGLQRFAWLALWSLALTLFQSFDVLIVYKKDFAFSILVEVGILGLEVLTIISFGKDLTLDSFIMLFAIVNLAKAGIFFVRLREYSVGGRFSRSLRGRLDIRYFGLAFPFFLLGFSGMLQTRIDLYAVSYFLPERQVGQYQVFINLMIYIQSFSNFILLPFVKNIYRLEYDTIQKITVKLFWFGASILTPTLALAHLVLAALYEFRMPLSLLVFGGLFALPIYAYLPIIYALYKVNLQTRVLYINFIGIMVNFLLNLFFLPRLGMIGAVIAAATAQWVMLIAYLVQNTVLRRVYALAMSELS